MARRLLTLHPVPESTASFRDLLRRRALTGMIEPRLRISPLVVLIALGFAALSPTPLRIALFGGASSLLVLLATKERGLVGASDRRLALNVIATGLLQLTVMFAAGGVAGPILPGTVLAALVSSILLRPSESGAFVLGIQIPSVWLFAVVHHQGWIPELNVPAYAGLYVAPGTPGVGPFLAAAFLSLMLGAAYAMGRYLRNVIGDLATEMAEERQASLEEHIQSARTMSALSGEIAHELKNPLASIKGLTALVQKELSGVPAERMDVVRREVDRMQLILDEFLTYSRPLLPLSVERTDLWAIAEDVVQLHEGLANERGVTLRLDEHAPTSVRCDPRKIRQVVINLLQNAIDATPSGGAVHVQVGARPGGAALTVKDEGRGIAASVRDRLFQVGVTSKAKGTGLGLVVARGVARQHGGDITLEDDPNGGARAVLSLPDEPPRDEPPHDGETPERATGVHAPGAPIEGSA